MTGTIKMKFDVTIQEITIDYVLGALLQISKHSEGTNDVAIAKQILILAAKRGDKGLFVSDWNQFITDLKVPRHKYFSLVKKLKDAGLLRKTKGRYYNTKNLARLFAKMATALNEFYMDIGVEAIE